ncbi:MAG: hypothetical protein EAZ15_04880 [Sphingobacteriales bacterium]|nr:MAG: hypothetical protein EAZ15_04880 [Sphingobacteriales bacterium]
MNIPLKFKTILTTLKNNPAIKFTIVFLILYFLFDNANKFFNNVNTPTAQYYNPYISEHFNYIQLLRTSLILSTVKIMEMLGYFMMYSKTQILALNGIPSNINYSCLGLGVLSFWVAFVLAFPKPIKQKLRFLIKGIVAIFFLNVFRLVILTILTVEIPNEIEYFTYHHDAFTFFVYSILFAMIYFWVKKNNIVSQN